MTDSAAPEGWYPDRGRFRWWDGTRWIDRYLDEERLEAELEDPVAKARRFGLVALGELIVLSFIQLAWLSRSEKILPFALMMIGPVIGVAIGSYFAGRFARRRKRPQEVSPHSMLWNIACFSGLVAAALVLSSAASGGFTTGALIPTFVLTTFGTVIVVATAKFMTPESFSSMPKPTEESS